MVVGGKASTTDDQEIAYGPWRVMTHKRFGNKPTMKVGPTKEIDPDPNNKWSGKAITSTSSPKSHNAYISDVLRSSKRQAALGQDDLDFNRCTSPTFMTSGLNEQIGGVSNLSMAWIIFV